MSREAVEAIIGRAVLDSEFRAALFADPDTVLAGFDLTQEEAAGLRAIDAESMEALAGTLDERISKTIGVFGPALIRPKPTPASAGQAYTPEPTPHKPVPTIEGDTQAHKPIVLEPVPPGTGAEPVPPGGGTPDGGPWPPMPPVPPATDDAPGLPHVPPAATDAADAAAPGHTIPVEPIVPPSSPS